MTDYNPLDNVVLKALYEYINVTPLRDLSLVPAKLIKQAVNEITRLLTGDLTEPEWQYFCHHRSEDDIDRFEQGCQSYVQNLRDKQQRNQKKGKPMVDPVAVGDLNSREPGTAARRNAGKPEFSQLPLHCLAGAARLAMLGAVKYSEYNYARGSKWSVYFNCTIRHLFDWFYGRRNVDDETQCHPLDHAIWNLLVLRHYTLAFENGDDRPDNSTLFHMSIADLHVKCDVEEFKRRTGYENVPECPTA